MPLTYPGDWENCSGLVIELSNQTTVDAYSYHCNSARLSGSKEDRFKQLRDRGGPIKNTPAHIHAKFVEKAAQQQGWRMEDSVRDQIHSSWKKREQGRTWKKAFNPFSSKHLLQNFLNQAKDHASLADYAAWLNSQLKEPSQPAEPKDGMTLVTREALRDALLYSTYSKYGDHADVPLLNEDGEFTQDAKTQLNTHINGSTVLRTFHPGGNNDFDKINEALLNPSIDNVMGVYMNKKSIGEAWDIAAGYQLATNQQPKVYSYRHEQEKHSESQQYGLSLLNAKEEHLNEHLKTFFRKHKCECLLIADKKGCKKAVKGLVKALMAENKIPGHPIEDISATILASILNGYLKEKSLILAARIGHAEVVSALAKAER